MRTTLIHYPFGMLMPERTFSSPDYRYGFNGKEKTDEINGDGNELDFGGRIYDSRLGRWFAIDKLASQQPSWSSYKAFKDNPIIYIDPDGNVEVLTYIIKGADGSVQVFQKTGVKDLVMTDGTQHSNGFVQKTHYYDFERIVTEIKNIDGTSTFTYEIKILYGDLKYSTIAVDPCGTTKDLTEQNGYEQEGGFTLTSSKPGNDGTPFKSKSAAEMVNIDLMMVAAMVASKKLGLPSSDPILTAKFIDSMRKVAKENEIQAPPEKCKASLCQNPACRLNNSDTLKSDTKKVNADQLEAPYHSTDPSYHGASGGEVEVECPKN